MCPILSFLIEALFIIKKVYKLAILLPGLHWLEQIFMVSYKYAMLFLSLVYMSSHEMRKRSYGSLWQMFLALSTAISYSVVVGFFPL